MNCGVYQQHARRVVAYSLDAAFGVAAGAITDRRKCLVAQ